MDYKKSFSLIIAALTGAGITLIASPKSAPVGEENLVLSEAERLVLAEKTVSLDEEGVLISEDKIILIAKKRFDKNTGEEINALVIKTTASKVQADIDGLNADIARLQAEVIEDTANLTEEYVEIPQYDEETGQAAAPITKFIDPVQLQAEIDAKNETITALQSQISKLQTVLDSANKLE